MPIDFLSAQDYDRAAQTLRTLACHNLSRLALAGGFAIELRILQRGGKGLQRPLHDIDFIASAFECIPDSLATEFLFRHIHPNDPPGKTLIQAVLPKTAVRVDVFRSYSSVMDRVSLISLAEFPSGPINIISIEDLAARNARLCWNLVENKPLSPKYARDFLRLLEVVSVDKVQQAWQDHRKPDNPESFAEAVHELRELIAARTDLLVIPTYSTDVREVCPRCHNSGILRLADADQILSLLGYC